MSNIVIGGNTYNGVNTLKVKNTNDEFVSFNENPFIVDASQAPDPSYLGKLCQDETTGQYYMVVRGNSDSFVLTNIPATNTSLCGSDIQYNNGVWTMVLISESTAYVYYSTDGSNWTLSLSQPSRFDSGGQPKICYGNGIWALYGLSTSVIKYTSDFVNWNTLTLSYGSSERCYQMAYGNNVFVAFTTYGSSTTNYRSYYTTNFSSWTYTGYSSGIAIVRFLNGYFHIIKSLTVSSATYTAFYKSIDGINWVEEFERISNYPNNNKSLIYVKGYFYYAHSGTDIIYKCAENDTTWTNISSGVSNKYVLYFVNNTFYIGSAFGRIYTSSDASSWTQLQFQSENGNVGSIYSDGTTIKALFTYLRSGISIQTFTTYLNSDSSDNLYYRPVYY